GHPLPGARRRARRGGVQAVDARAPAADPGVVERRARLHGAKRARRHRDPAPARARPRRPGDRELAGEAMTEAMMRPAAPTRTVRGAAARGDIQGLVYSAWTDHRYAGFLSARLGDAPRASRTWLDATRRLVTPASRHRRRTHGRLQVALSPTGLAALGVP